MTRLFSFWATKKGVAQPSPGTARRVRNHLAATWPAERIALGVPHVAVRQRLVNAICAGEKDGYRFHF